MNDVLTDLGTVLMVWAHPDDETYLVGGLSAALTDAGQRVVCVTATRGEAGGTAADLARIRTTELEAALDVLGVEEHHWLDYADGGCASVDDDEAAARIRAVVDEVRPDTVVTFGPDGFTGHPDHRAVSRWVDLALVGGETSACCTPSPASTAPTPSSTRTTASSSSAGRASAPTTSSPSCCLSRARCSTARWRRCSRRSRRRPGWWRRWGWRGSARGWPPRPSPNPR